MKKCTGCDQVKYLDLFSLQKTGVSGRNAKCKACKNDIAKKYFKSNSGIILMKQKGRRLKNLLKKHGLTEETYMGMLKNQNYSCAICEKPNDNLRIDHNHKTGYVRGLLCNPCNLGLGQFKDSPDNLNAAIAYLTM